MALGVALGKAQQSPRTPALRFVGRDKADKAGSDNDHGNDNDDDDDDADDDAEGENKGGTVPVIPPSSASEAEAPPGSAAKAVAFKRTAAKLLFDKK